MPTSNITKLWVRKMASSYFHQPMRERVVELRSRRCQTSPGAECWQKPMIFFYKHNHETFPELLWVGGGWWVGVEGKNRNKFHLELVKNTTESLFLYFSLYIKTEKKVGFLGEINYSFNSLIEWFRIILGGQKRF